MIVLEATRKSDNTILYFRDQESYDDYVLTYEEELTSPQVCFEVPFGQTVIDWNPERANMSTLFKLNGISMKNMSLKDLSGTDTPDHSYEDTPKRMKELRNMARKTYDFENGKLVETNDDYREINIRKDKALNNATFRAFVDTLNKEELDKVTEVFVNHNLDFSKLEEYFDEELNMDVSLWLKDYDTQKQYLQALLQYQETDDYKKHKNFIDTLTEAYNVIREMDNSKDLTELNLKEPEVKINDTDSENS